MTDRDRPAHQSKVGGAGFLGRLADKIKIGSGDTGVFSQVTTTKDAITKATAASLRGARDSVESWLGQSWPLIITTRKGGDGKPTNQSGVLSLSELMVMGEESEDFERDAEGNYTGRLKPYEADDPRVLRKFFGIDVKWVD